MYYFMNKFFYKIYLFYAKKPLNKIYLFLFIYLYKLT